MSRWPAGAAHHVARRRLAVAALVAVTVACTSCAASGTAISTPFATTAPVLEHGPVYEVKIATIGGLGPVLVDGQGITLYLYESDRQGSPSRLLRDLRRAVAAAHAADRGDEAGGGSGHRAQLLGTAPRTDGTTQITYNGWPLYLWPPDRAPGKATGQGLTNAGGRWYVVDAAGNAVQTA